MARACAGAMSFVCGSLRSPSGARARQRGHGRCKFHPRADCASLHALLLTLLRTLRRALVRRRRRQPRQGAGPCGEGMAGRRAGACGAGVWRRRWRRQAMAMASSMQSMASASGLCLLLYMAASVYGCCCRIWLLLYMADGLSIRAHHCASAGVGAAVGGRVRWWLVDEACGGTEVRSVWCRMASYSSRGGGTGHAIEGLYGLL